jgi:hypothetical protein
MLHVRIRARVLALFDELHDPAPIFCLTARVGNTEDRREHA